MHQPEAHTRRRTETTYFYERWRAISSGIMETAQSTFLLLIAVRFFEAPPLAKAIVVAGGSLGLMGTPLTVWIASRLQRPTSFVASRIVYFGACCFMVAALFPYQYVYIVCIVGGMTSMMSVVPLLTQMYQENYPGHERGSRYSKTVVVRIITAFAFGTTAGWLLDRGIGQFPIILVGFAAALVFSGYCLYHIPTSPLTKESGSRPFRGFTFLRTDLVFRRTLIAWMLMGIGNLMMLPLRVEYLANPRYGITLSASTIALITIGIPNLSRILSIMIWGRAFDRMNFFVMRAILNLGFGTGIFLFFLSDSTLWFCVAAVVFGITMAGGDVAWSLWVTKLAPPNRVADYMSVHTCLTGMRHAVAPFLAFSLIQVMPIRTLSWIAVAFILTSVALMIPLFKHGDRLRRAGAALPKEDQE